jgi:nucleoside-diphosphate-sugar epimerase
MQRILVLGAGGFVGRRLISVLLSSDWATPIAGVRRAAATAHADVMHRTVDVTDGQSVARALDGVDAVVNCVAGSPAAISEGARLLYAAAAGTGTTPRIVHLSTMAVYGDAAGLVDESAPLRANGGDYAMAKSLAEQHAAEYANGVILRPGCIYGPESPQWSMRIGQWLTARRLGDLGADGDGYCNLVYIDDVIDAIVRSLRGGLSGPFNLAMSDPPTWNEFLIRYGRALRAVPIRRISHRRLMIEGKLLAPPLRILELALRRFPMVARSVPPPIAPSLLRLMRQEIRLDVRRAMQNLALRWTPLDKGLEDTARWYLECAARTTP